jgi:hypothetical protein
MPLRCPDCRCLTSAAPNPCPDCASERWRAAAVDTTDTPKLWRDMTDAEKGELLLAHHEGKEIECNIDNGVWFYSDPQWNAAHAYRIKPKAPKVEKVTDKRQAWLSPTGEIRIAGQGDAFGKIANITHTYTITDGIVTACDTIIHD